MSILGLTGADVNMAAIAKCAQITGGTVNVLKPSELMRQFRLITHNPVIASDVRVSIHTHPSLTVTQKVCCTNYRMANTSSVNQYEMHNVCNIFILLI